MNFVVIKDTGGVSEFITPPLDGMILPGVTRDYVLVLARNHVSGVKRLKGFPDAHQGLGASRQYGGDYPLILEGGSC